MAELSGPPHSSANHAVDITNDGRVQVMAPLGQFSNLVFELLFGLGTDALGPRRKDEAQEGIPFAIGGDLGLVGTQGEP